MRPPGPRRVLWWDLIRACPRCGNRRIFRRYFTLLQACPACGYRFAREEGYWVGALIINMAFTEALFLAVFLGYLIASAGEVSWGHLLAIAGGVNLLFPVVFYPWSKTIWMAFDLVVMKKLEV